MFRVALGQALSDGLCVKVAATKEQKSDAALLDQATDNLLRAVKQRMLRKQGRLDYPKLRKEGYSDRFLARVEEA